MNKRKTVNLNDARDFTVRNVQVMLADADDTKRNQIRVTREGIAFVSEEPNVGNVNLDGLAFRLETWQPGNDYIGFHAARDEQYATTIYEVLRRNWPNPTSDFIDEW